jgi:hypothetical protein
MAATLDMSGITFSWPSLVSSPTQNYNGELKSGQKLCMYTPVHMSMKGMMSSEKIFVKDARITMGSNSESYIFDGNNSANCTVLVEHNINGEWKKILTVTDIFSFTNIHGKEINHKKYTKEGVKYQVINVKKLDSYGSALELKLEVL